MNLQLVLQKANMSEKESQIYLALLELGQAPASVIAKKTGLNRTTVYDQLSLMQDKGFISQVTQNKIRYFTALDPTLLVQTLRQNVEGLIQSLPKLLELARYFPNQPKVHFFQGMEGLKEVYLDTLKGSNYELYSFLNENEMTQEHNEFFHSYIKQRIKQNIKAYVIAPLNPHTMKYKQKDHLELRETRLIKDPFFEISVELQMYDNKVSIVSFNKKTVGVIIESEDIYISLKNIFHLIWKNIV